MNDPCTCMHIFLPLSFFFSPFSTLIHISYFKIPISIEILWANCRLKVLISSWYLRTSIQIHAAPSFPILFLSSYTVFFLAFLNYLQFLGIPTIASLTLFTNLLPLEVPLFLVNAYPAHVNLCMYLALVI